jgi:protocatechuate 3,4-dioxygenase beta subunit
MSAYAKFFFRPAKGEHISTVIGPELDARAVISGRVVDSRERPIEDAILLLYRVSDGELPELLSRFCTDEDGQFIFGPLEGGRLYMIKVYKGGIQMRELEIKTE